MEPGKNEAMSIEQDAQLLLNIQSELQNMGKSLQCPLCLSTFNDPVMSPCFHAFCRECILTSLQGKEEFRSKCPICKDKCTKRGLVSSDHLADLAKGYKLTVRAFGFAPIVYSKGISMTQLVDDDDGTASMDIGKNDPEKSDDQMKNLKSLDEEVKQQQHTKFKTKAGPSLLRCHEHLEVSRCVHTVLLNAVEKIPVASLLDNISSKSTASNKNVSGTRSQQEIKLKTLLRDQEKIIEVDEKALVHAAVTESKTKTVSVSAQNGSMDELDLDTHSLETQKAELGNEPDIGFDEDLKTSALSITNFHKNSAKKFRSGKHASYPSSVASVSRNDATNHLEKSQKISTQDLYEASAEELREKEVVDRSAEMLLQFARSDIKSVKSCDDNFTILDETISRCSSSNDELDVEESIELVSDHLKTSRKATETFSIGSLVQVQSRTGPGMNKPGGVARVTALHERNVDTVKYDVSYVLGGKERLVDAIYVSTMNEESVSKARRNDKENIQDKKRSSSEIITDVSKEPSSQRSRISKDSCFTTQKYLDLAIDCYELRLKEHKECINVVTSGLNETDLNTVKVLCAEMSEHNVKMKISDCFDPINTTLCISSLEKRIEAVDNVANLRTLKLMRAALNCVPIMNLSWVSAFLERKSFPSIEFHHIVHTLPSKNDELMIIKDSVHSTSARFGVMKLASTKHPSMKKTKQIMEKHLALICGQFKSPGSPKRADIQLLLKESGATISSSPSEFMKVVMNEITKTQTSHFGNSGVGFIVICDDSSSDSTSGIPKKMETLLEPANTNRNIVSFSIATSNWLFDCISCGSVLSSDQYEPQSPLGKSLWLKTKT